MKLTDPIFDKAVQLNVRIPLRTRARLDRYMDYMSNQSVQRPHDTLDWPSSLAAIVREALDDWLLAHPTHRGRTHLREDDTLPPPTPKQQSKIKPKEQ